MMWHGQLDCLPRMLPPARLLCLRARQSTARAAAWARIGSMLRFRLWGTRSIRLRAVRLRAARRLGSRWGRHRLMGSSWSFRAGRTLTCRQAHYETLPTSQHRHQTVQHASAFMLQLLRYLCMTAVFGMHLPRA